MEYEDVTAEDLGQDVPADDPEGIVQLALGDLNGATAEDLERALRLLRQAAEGSDAIRLRIIRNLALDRLSMHGVQSPAALVDAALAGLGPSSQEKPGQGARLSFETPEPWPAPVKGSEVLEEMRAVFERFVSAPSEALVAMSLWVLHTFAYDLFHVTPRLCVFSPVKRCGKTRTLETLRAMVARPLQTANITAAAVFRVIEQSRPTLLIDEADTFLGEQDELRGVLNSGHSKSSAFVVRAAGEDNEPKVFSTWAPVAVALIGKLPATLEDRSVAVPMKRRGTGESVERLRADRLARELEDVRRQAVRWVQDHQEELRAAEPDVPVGLDDRARDNREPLLAIADIAAREWPGLGRDAARMLSASRDEGEGAAGIQLLEDLRELFRNRERLPTAGIVATLTTMEERPWPEWKRGKPLTSRGLARLLRPFDVRPKNIRLPDGTVAKGYERADLEDTFSRYLGAGSATNATWSPTNELRRFASATEDPGVADTNARKFMPDNDLVDNTDYGYGGGSSSGGRTMSLTAEEIVRRLAARGVTLETRGDRLRWRAPGPGVLTPADLALLRTHKPDLLEVLRLQEEADRVFFGLIPESERAMDRVSRISWRRWER